MMIDISEAFVHQEMSRILLESGLLPLSIEELSSEIHTRYLTQTDIDPAEMYSPHKKYAAGDRLFHTANRYRDWFTVAEPVTESSFIARFEDGREDKKLAHRQPDIGKYAWVPEMVEQRIREMIITQTETHEEIVEVNGLYVHHTISNKIPFDRLSNSDALATLATLRMERNNLDREDDLQELCNRYELSSLYYLAPWSNVSSILDHGILAKNLAPDGHASFANDDIQARRHARRPTRAVSLCLHDYVPVFFAPRPPLLYSFQEHQHHLVYLLVDPTVLLEPGVVFAPVNAVSTKEFYDDISDLEHLDWYILHAKYWNSDDQEEHRRNKLHRQAEAEIPVTIPLEKITAIIVYDDEKLHLLREEIRARGLDITAMIDRRLYY